MSISEGAKRIIAKYMRVAPLPPDSTYFPDALGREPGEPLDPKHHNVAQLANIQANQGPMHWASLYQQDPLAGGAGLLGRSDFVSPDPRLNRLLTRDAFDHQTQGLLWVRGYDFAYTAKETNKSDPDWTVGALMAFKVDPWENTFEIYLRHIVRYRDKWSRVKNNIVDQALLDGNSVYIAGEGIGGQKVAMDNLLEMNSLANYSVFPSPLPSGDKVARASFWIDRAKAGRMWLCEGTWNQDFFDEIEAFPNGRHDDICLLPGTLVPYSPHGRVWGLNGCQMALGDQRIVGAIEDIGVGDLVQTHTGQWKPVTERMVRHYAGTVVAIKAQGARKVTMTPNHPILCVQNTHVLADGRPPRATGQPKWVPAGEIKPGDSVLEAVDQTVTPVESIDMATFVLPERGEATGKRSNAGMYLSCIKVGEDTISFNNPRSHPVNRHIEVTGDLMRLLGYYVAEGSRGRHNITWCFSADEDEQVYVNDVVTQLQEIFGVMPSVQYKSNITIISVSSWVLHDFFGQFGRGSANLQIPQWIMHLPVDLQVQFLKGAWRGDGCATAAGQLVYVSTSVQLIDAMKMLLYRVGIVPGVTISRKDGRGPSMIAGNMSFGSKPLYCLNVGGDYVRQLAALFEMKNPRPEEREYRVADRIVDGYVHRRVRTVEFEEYEGDVHNFEVEDDHSYHTTSFVVHNCDAVSTAYFAAGVRAQEYVFPATGNNAERLVVNKRW